MFPFFQRIGINIVLFCTLLLIPSSCLAENEDNKDDEEIFAADLDGPVILINDYDHYPKPADLRKNYKTILIGAIDSGDSLEVSHTIRNVSKSTLSINQPRSSSTWVNLKVGDDKNRDIMIKPGDEIPLKFLVNTPPSVWRENETGSKLRQTDISFIVTNATKTFRLAFQALYTIKAGFWVDPLPVVVHLPIPGEIPKPYVINVFIKEPFAPFIRSIEFDPPTIGIGGYQLNSIPEGIKLSPSKKGTIWKYSFSLYTSSTYLKTSRQRKPMMKILFDLSRHYRIHIPIVIINPETDLTIIPPKIDLKSGEISEELITIYMNIPGITSEKSKKIELREDDSFDISSVTWITERSVRLELKQNKSLKKGIYELIFSLPNNVKTDIILPVYVY